MEHTIIMSATFAQKQIGLLAFLGVTYRQFHMMVKSRHIKDWCAKSWSIVVQFGILYPNIGELEKVQKSAARFVIGKTMRNMRLGKSKCQDFIFCLQHPIGPVIKTGHAALVIKIT